MPDMTTQDPGPAAAQDNRPSVYAEDGKLIFRASAIGMCPRALYAYAANYDPTPYPKNMMTAASAGIILEPKAKQRLIDMGFVVRNVVDKLDLPVSKSIIRGAIDADMTVPAGLDISGISGPGEHSGKYRTYFNNVHELLNADEDVLLVGEVKGMSDKGFREWRQQRFKIRPKYAWQLTVYMRILKRSALYIVWNRDTEEMDLWYVPSQPVPFVDIIKKVRMVEDLYAARNRGEETFPACVDSGDFCPFRYLHDDYKQPTVQMVQDADVISWMSSYCHAGEQIKDLEKYQSGLKKRVDEYMSKYNHEKLSTPQGFCASRVGGNAKIVHVLDEAALRSECPDIAAKYTRTETKTTATQLKIEAPKPKKPGVNAAATGMEGETGAGSEVAANA